MMISTKTILSQEAKSTLPLTLITTTKKRIVVDIID